MSNPLAPLAALRQFIAVKLVPLADGKTDKLPLTPAGHLTPKALPHEDKSRAGAHNPANWMSWSEAHALATRLGPGHGIGFVITEGCGFVCIDIDGCVTPDGQYTQIVHDLSAQLGAHVVWELSQSRRGLHLWMRAAAVGPHRKKNIPLHIECYSSRRFILLGEAFAGDMDQPCAGLAAVLGRYFPPPTPGSVGESGPVPEWRGPTDDDDLIRRARAAISTTDLFGGGNAVQFADLWDANEAVLSKRWPSDNGGYDRSSADSALATRLSFWAGKDVARIERLMRQSALVREKWDAREDYLLDTITNACEFNPQVCQDKPSAALDRIEPACAGQSPVEPVVMPQPLMADGTSTPFATREDQVKLFAGHVYVLDQHRVLTPKGMLLRPDQFRALFGGLTFLLGGQRNKTTNNAWEAFTENQDVTFPRADSTCFRPEHPFGAVLTEGGVRRVNTYLPPNVRMVEGDAGPLLRHLHTLLPNGDDATMLLSYLAACVQYPGRKFPWAPVLQGVEGNGKTVFSIAAAYAVGTRYTHWPKASKLVKQFNGWMVGKVLYCVEDIYMPGVQGDFILEEMKPMITGGRGIEIESKGVDQVSADICGNFIINTNHKDGVRKTANDRRYCMLYCAQQEAADLKRDFGDVERYMRDLYHWLDHEDGLAIFAHYLRAYTIPERFDPTRLAQRAPHTSSHEAAVEAGLGMVEQLVLEAIDEGKAGFKGGWVSSFHLKLLLEAVGRDRMMTPQRRHNVLKTLGFVPHPGLPKGRVANPVATDTGYPILFVRAGSPQCLVGSSAADVAQAYVKAQS